ncbi:MAG: hypothetical protein AB7I48_18015 [Planctomycetaceae bacterium]
MIPASEVAWPVEKDTHWIEIVVMAIRKHSENRARSDRSKATSEGMRRSAEIAAKYGLSRGHRDAQNLTRKDRIFRIVCDARAAGAKVSPELVAQLLPMEAKTISSSTFNRYVEIAISGEANVPEGRSWPKSSRGYRGDASAHQRRVSELSNKAKRQNNGNKGKDKACTCEGGPQDGE